MSSSFQPRESRLRRAWLFAIWPLLWLCRVLLCLPQKLYRDCRGLLSRSTAPAESEEGTIDKALGQLENPAVREQLQIADQRTLKKVENDVAKLQDRFAELAQALNARPVGKAAPPLSPDQQRFVESCRQRASSVAKTLDSLQALEPPAGGQEQRFLKHLQKLETWHASAEAAIQAARAGQQGGAAPDEVTADAALVRLLDLLTQPAAAPDRLIADLNRKIKEVDLEETVVVLLDAASVDGSNTENSARISQVLESARLELIDPPAGSRFDNKLHEHCGDINRPGLDRGCIAEVRRSGYRELRQGGRVLRRAQVVTAK